MKKTILMFDVTSEKRSAIRSLSGEQNFLVREVPAASYSMRIGGLAEGKQVPARKKQGFQPEIKKFPMEMILFCGFSSEDLDCFLSGYRALPGHVAPVPLKAVLTPYNKDWSANALFRELFLEHMNFSKS